MKEKKQEKSNQVKKTTTRKPRTIKTTPKNQLEKNLQVSPLQPEKKVRVASLGKVNNPTGKGLPRGRPKGVRNKVNRDIKDAFKNLITNNIDNFEKWLKQVADINPKEALKLIIDLSPYVVPKLSSQDIKLEEVKEDIDLSKLTKEELEQFLKLVDKVNDKNTKDTGKDKS